MIYYGTVPCYIMVLYHGILGYCIMVYYGTVPQYIKAQYYGI